MCTCNRAGRRVLGNSLSMLWCSGLQNSARVPFAVLLKENERTFLLAGGSLHLLWPSRAWAGNVRIKLHLSHTWIHQFRHIKERCGKVYSSAINKIQIKSKAFLKRVQQGTSMGYKMKWFKPTIQNPGPEHHVPDVLCLNTSNTANLLITKSLLSRRGCVKVEIVLKTSRTI